MRRLAACLLMAVLLAPAACAQAPTSEAITRASVQLWIPAVAQRDDGSLFGVASELEVVQQRPGTGEIYLSTTPLTQIDMQGSARLAVQTAAAITGRRVDDADYFFSVRTDSVTVGGPSAGGAMAVASVALLQGWSLRGDVVMTGMINPDGSIGPIGGVPQKLEAAASVDAKRFLVPLGQANVVDEDGSTVDVRERGRDQYDIEVTEVADLYDAVEPFTGFQLVRPTPSKDPLKDQAYTNITRTLATNLTEQAARRGDEVQARFDAVQASMGASDRSAASEQLAIAADRARTSREAENESRFYLASSRAFQGLVAAGYAAAIVGFHEQGADPSTYASDYLAETQRRIDAVGAEINRSFPYPASRLDAQAAAEQRYLDALASEADAQAALAEGNRGAALEGSSFARERAESARWWSRIGDLVSATAPAPLVTRANVDSLWESYAETAQLQLEYANLVVGGQSIFQTATDALQDSQAAHARGRVAASLFEMIEALARTSTALVAVGGIAPVEQRLDRLAAGAAYQIELAQGQGAPPVYAISLFELASSTRAQDPVEAYATYSQARISARASLSAANIQAPAPRTERSGGGIPFLDGSGFPAWGWIWVGAAVVVGVFMLGAWIGSAGREDSSPPPAVEAPPPRPAPTPTLVYRPPPIKGRSRLPGRTRRSKRSP